MTTPQQAAFLDMIAFSEIGPALLAVSDNGYNVLVGSTAKKPLLFSSYITHPHILNREMNSTAAGRYQLLYRYWVAYSRMLDLPDFSPESQDKIALEQIKEQGAMGDIAAGRIANAIDKCSNIWASFPNAGYGQHEHKASVLLAAFNAAGGYIA